MEYALINLSNNEIVETRFFDSEPVDVSHKGIKWLPLVVDRPGCNLDFQIEEPPVTTVKEDCVEVIYSVRNLTKEELREKLYNQINEQLFGVNIFTGVCLLSVFNQLQEFKGENKISQTDFIDLILDLHFFAVDTKENLIQYDKLGNPIE